MKSLVVASVVFVVSGSAFADGSVQQYDQSIVNHMALSPNETIVNDDGAQEAPSAKMTGTARAFRNGIINGRKMQKEDDESAVDTPPLPSDYPSASPSPRVLTEDDQSRYTTIPAQALPVRPYSAYHASPYRQYTYAPAPEPSPGVVTNTYSTTTHQSYSQTSTSTYSAPSPYAYAAPQQPVYYTPPPGPPQATYVVIPGVPSTLATGYWPRGYRPVYPPLPRGYEDDRNW